MASLADVIFIALLNLSYNLQADERMHLLLTFEQLLHHACDYIISMQLLRIYHIYMCVVCACVRVCASLCVMHTPMDRALCSWILTATTAWRKKASSACFQVSTKSTTASAQAVSLK